MSYQQRKEIAYWFCLLFGIITLIIQLYRYFNNELQLTTGEGIIFILAVVLIWNPHILSKGASLFIKSKTNESDRT